MAEEKTAVRITELDHLSIKENLKNYLRSQEEFQDYDFDGAGLNVLLDVLAYNTHYMGFYLNAVANEMFIDTAQLRESVISHAKTMNYVPGSKQGALSRIDINITPSASENQNVSSITLEKYTRLLGRDIDGVNYPFVTLYSNTTSKDSGSFSFSNVYVKQGEVVTLQYLMEPTNSSRIFEIPSSNVDTTTLTITVQESATNTDIYQYTLADDITEVNANSRVYFIEENQNGFYNFYFGDNVIGRKPANNNIIICTYLDNVGSLSNNITAFTFVQSIGGVFSDNVTVTSAVSSYGGVPKESVEQVRFRAPYFYTTQNRAVTEDDYRTLMLKSYNYIDDIRVWGGEDNDPVTYGKVYMSIKTRGNFKLTNFEKERIKNDLIQTRNVLTVTPEIVDPEYTFVTVSGTVYYNPSITPLTSSQLLSLVKAAIYDYNDNELRGFNYSLNKYKLQEYINNSDKSITGSDFHFLLQKRVEINTSQTKTYEINFNTPIRKSACIDRISTYPTLAVFDSAGVSRNVYVEEQVENRTTGIDSIVITNTGQNYTSPPTVTISGDGSGATAVATILSGRVDTITVTNPGTNYTTAVVNLSGGEGSGAIAQANLEGNRETLRSFYYKTNGEEVFVNENFGTVFYPEGKIVIDSLRSTSVETNEYYERGILTILAPPLNEIIKPTRNGIITFDENDTRAIQLTMVAET